MNVTFYTGFTKRVNSTKRPSGGTTLSVALKDDTSIESPVFRLDKGNNAAYMNYNYCQFNGAYYYIDDVVLTNRNIYEYHCRKDVLATEKNRILASTQYVTRSTNRYNVKTIDAAYPATGVVKSSTTQATFNTSGFSGLSTVVNSTAVLGIIGGSIATSEIANSRFGAVTYYIMNMSTLAKFINYLTLDTSYFAIEGSDLPEGMQKALINPFQYIVSCFIIPCSYDSVYSQLHSWSSVASTSTIEFGYQFSFDTQSTKCAKLLQGLATFSPRAVSTIIRAWQWDVELPKHEQTYNAVTGESTDRDYLNKAPYTTHHIFADPFGQVLIDSDFMMANNYKVRISCDVDIITGKGYMNISNQNESTIINRVPSQVGVNLPLAQVSIDQLAVQQAETKGVASLVSGLVGVGSNLASGNVVGAINSGITAFTGSVNAQADEMRAKQPTVQKSGVQDSLFSFVYPAITHTFSLVTEMDKDRFGAPCNVYGQLSYFEGFCQVDSPVYGSAIRADDNLSVIQFLKGGIYLE